MVRAEACAKDFYAALDCAITKLDGRLRRAADRRRVHRGRHAPVSVAAATAGLPDRPAELRAAGRGPGRHGRRRRSSEHDDNQPWRIVREKEHPADPMTVDDALFQMELVGHDFYLFHDKESGRPSVVYRRRGYDYGILSLESRAEPPPADARATLRVSRLRQDILGEQDELHVVDAVRRPGRAGGRAGTPSRVNPAFSSTRWEPMLVGSVPAISRAMSVSANAHSDSSCAARVA